jgi:hypothetical protein
MDLAGQQEELRRSAWQNVATRLTGLEQVQQSPPRQWRSGPTKKLKRFGIMASYWIGMSWEQTYGEHGSVRVNRHRATP